MLSATLVSTKRVSLEGLKTQWKITKDDEVAWSAGMEYVKLCPRSTSLRALILENNPCVQDDRTAVVPLTRSRGLSHIMKLRNEQQAASFMESVSPSACTLFASAAEKKLKVTHPRRDQGELRKNPQHLSISLNVDGMTKDVNVLRSIHPMDNVFVAYEPSMIAHTLCFIRAEGFDDKKEKQAALPEGVHRRGDKFVVRYTRARLSCHGKKRYGYKTCNSLDDANAVRLNPPQSDDEGGNQDAVESDEGEHAENSGQSVPASPTANGGTLVIL